MYCRLRPACFRQLAQRGDFTGDDPLGPGASLNDRADECGDRLLLCSLSIRQNQPCFTSSTRNLEGLLQHD